MTTSNAGPLGGNEELGGGGTAGAAVSLPPAGSGQCSGLGPGSKASETLVIIAP